MKAFIIISPGFPKNEEDTTCLPAQQVFVRTLNSLFPEMRIIILALQYPFFKKTYQWNGNTVISFNGMKSRFLGRPFHWLEVYRQLKQVHKTFTIDGILSFWCAETALIGKYFSRNHSIDHFCWILGQDARKKNLFVRWIKPKSEELIALSSFLQNEFHVNHGVKPKYLIPNGIATSSFKHFKASKSIDIVGVGSLIPLKQYSIFVEIVHRIKQSIPEIKVMVCGKGPETDNLKRQIKSLGLEGNIVLTGELLHEKILETMQQAKILLHPSSFEGYSTVCLEALYAGCHVVSFWSGEETPVHHWHIARDVKEMEQMCLSILQSHSTDYSPVVVHRMEDSAKEIMRLYDHSEASTV